MEKLPKGKNAKGLAETVIRMLTPYKKWVHPITSDNGTEFAGHKMIAKKLNAPFFFCHPYSSWERGLNEYTNGLVRQYIPKGEDFEKYDNLYIKNVQYKINKRPREKLNFDCPKRFFFCSFALKSCISGFNLRICLSFINATLINASEKSFISIRTSYLYSLYELFFIESSNSFLSLYITDSELVISYR